MIEAGVSKCLVKGCNCASLWVGAPEDEAADSCVDHCASTHQAWLFGYIDGCALKSPACSKGSALSDDLDFSVGCGVFLGLAAIVSPSKDKVVPHKHCAYGHFSFTKSRNGLG
jgi:hypothetical protein